MIVRTKIITHHSLFITRNTKLYIITRAERTCPCPGGGGGGVRQAAVHSCVIISIIICVSCYCKNQISARQISSKTRVRRREIEFLSSISPKISRGSMPRNPPRWFVSSPLNIRPLPNIHFCGLRHSPRPSLGVRTQGNPLPDI